MNLFMALILELYQNLSKMEALLNPAQWVFVGVAQEKICYKRNMAVTVEALVLRGVRSRIISESKKD